MVGYTALMQTDERVGLEKRDRYVRALENHHDSVRRDDRPAARRRQHEHVPELTGRGARRGRDPTGALGTGRAGSHRCSRGRGDRRTRAAYGRSGEHRRPDRVLRGSRRSDVVRLRVRPDQEPERRRRRPAGAIQAQERRAPLRALRGLGRRTRGAGCRGARGQRRAIRQPAEQPARPSLAVDRSSRRAGFARRVCPRTPRGHHHRPGRSRKDAAPRRARPRALARVPGRRRVRRARRRHRRRAVPRHRRGHAGREGGGGTDARRRHRRADRREEGAPAPRQPRAGRVRRSGHRPVGRALPRATDRDDEQDAAQDRCRTRVPARPARASTDGRFRRDRVPRRLSGDRVLRRPREDDQRLLRADTHRTPRRSRRSADAWTVFRSRSSSPPPVCGSSLPSRCSNASTTRYSSSPPARATDPSGSRRCARRSTGATRC